MEIIKVFFTAAVEGFNRLIPVSHSGYEKLMKFLYVDLSGGVNDSIYPLLIQLAVIISLIYFLRADLLKILKAIGGIAKDILKRQFKAEPKEEDKNTVLMIIFASAVFVFVPVFSHLFSAMLNNLLIISLAFLASGAFIYHAVYTKERKLSEKNEAPFNALSVGFFKVLSIIPGFSGIGGMYFACITNGFRKEFSFKFTYIITLIATLVSFIKNITALFSGVTISYNVFAYILAFLASLATSGGAFYLVNLTMKKNCFRYFGLYNIIIGIFVFLIWMRG